LSIQALLYDNANDLGIVSDAALKKRMDYEDLQRELSNVNGNRINRFVSKDSDLRTGKADDPKNTSSQVMRTLQTFEVGSAGWQAAYDQNIQLSIDGEDFQIQQGKVYEWAKNKEEQYRKELDQARENGASPERILELQQACDAVKDLKDKTDPRYGKADAQDIQDSLDNSDILKDDFKDAKQDFAPDAPASNEAQANNTITGASAAGQILDLPGHEGVAVSHATTALFTQAASPDQVTSSPALEGGNLSQDQEMAKDTQTARDLTNKSGLQI